MKRLPRGNTVRSTSVLAWGRRFIIISMVASSHEFSINIYIYVLIRFTRIKQENVDSNLRNAKALVSKYCFGYCAASCKTPEIRRPTANKFSSPASWADGVEHAKLLSGNGGCLPNLATVRLLQIAYTA